MYSAGRFRSQTGGAQEGMRPAGGSRRRQHRSAQTNRKRRGEIPFQRESSIRSTTRTESPRTVIGMGTMLS